MWGYNHTYNSDELYHHGILGMKWGVRRYQNKNGSLTSQGKKRYSATESDEKMYGKKGAKRIAERRNRGDSYRKATTKELGRQIAQGILSSAALGTTAYLISSGKGEKLVSKGRAAAKNLWNSQFDSMVIDVNGNIIGKYRNSVKNVANAVNSLVPRR